MNTAVGRGCPRVQAPAFDLSGHAHASALKRVERMWAHLDSGRTFDLVLVVTPNRYQRDRLTNHLERRGGWNERFPGRPVEVASLDELGRPWAGGNFDASLFAIQRIRHLLVERGIPDGEGMSLAVLAAGKGTRAYPLTAAEGGNKSMLRTPAEMDGRPLRVIELVIAQYHQILEEMEPGRIHVAAGDHVLAWSRPPLSPGGQHVQLFSHRVSFGEEAEACGLLDSHGPRWNDRDDLRRRIGRRGHPDRLPVLSSLGEMGLLKSDPGDGSLVRLLEKADVPTILNEFGRLGAEAEVSWWDWSVSPEAARVLLAQYGDLLGRGIDFSMDVLEPATLSKEMWRLRRPFRDPELWERANILFENPEDARPSPLGRIGVADAGLGAHFADLGSPERIHEAFSTALGPSPEAWTRRALFGVHLEKGSIFVGNPPHPRVEVEPGAIVIEGQHLRSGHIGSGGIVVGPRVGELITRGRCIAYRIRGPGETVMVGDDEVTADVIHRERRHRVRSRLFGATALRATPAFWERPLEGNVVSFAELQADLVRREETALGSPQTGEPTRRKLSVSAQEGQPLRRAASAG